MNIIYRKATVNDIDNLAKMRSIFIMESRGCSEIERNKIELANKSYFENSIPEDKFIAWIALDTEKIVATSGLSFYNLCPSYYKSNRIGCIYRKYVHT